MHDVGIVGYGPVGATLAGLLAPDVDVAVFDRATDVYPLPRAAHIDHEAMRVLQAAGVADEVFPTTAPIRGMHFLDRVGGQRLFGFDGADEVSPLGWPRGLMFHQPELETILRAGARRRGVVPELGQEVEAVTDRGDHVELVVRDLATGEARTERARYVVGCDGARSTVRAAAGIAIDDIGFDEPWLVIDVLLRRPLDLPDVCYQVCDPARPATYVPMPGMRRRWEFMLLPGEDPADVERPEVFRRLLADWVDPDDVEVVRSAVYRFHALVASPWRTGQLLLAGDAAHQMPPFLGQGMCSGIRDAANLAWKLRRVLGAASDESLLDTYEPERSPHVRTIIDVAVTMGSIICTLDADVAAARDRQFLGDPDAGPGGEAADLVAALGDGVFSHDEHGAVAAPAGRMFVQPTVGGRRLDDVLPDGFVGLRRGEGVASQAPELEEWFEEHGCEAVLLRPDRYVFGVAKTDADLPALIRELEAQIGTTAPSWR